VQFWFFYTFNYQALSIGGAKAGFHEGDWESVSMLLSAKTHTPRFVWMARHDDEGQFFAFDEHSIEKVDGRLRVFAARGSHADYESCGTKPRRAAPLRLIDDHIPCGSDQQLHLDPAATPITDLSRVAWACWHGRFGPNPGDVAIANIPHESDHGPLAPLWQQRFGSASFEPCRNVGPQPSRAGSQEEVLRPATAARLSAGAAHMDGLVQTCPDWEQPANVGVYMVACSPDVLRSYAQRGYEDPRSRGIQVFDESNDDRSRATPIPAVRRDPTIRRLDTWRITTKHTARHVDIYASCQAGSGLLSVLFRNITLRPHHPLRLNDITHTRWQLRDTAANQIVKQVAPQIVRAPATDAPTACS
jgi:hypothetical protein